MALQAAASLLPSAISIHKEVFINQYSSAYSFGFLFVLFCFDGVWLLCLQGKSNSSLKETALFGVALSENLKAEFNPCFIARKVKITNSLILHFTLSLD